MSAGSSCASLVPTLDGRYPAAWDRIVTPILPGQAHCDGGGRFGDLVKAVVDIARGVMVLDAEMHADEEALLLEEGSRQADLWGIDLYPDPFGTPDFIEFDPMIDLRPRQGNRSRSLSLAEQPGNAGSEVGRAIRARTAGDADRFGPALERALELLDLTLADERWRGPRRREIARARDVVCDYLVGDNVYRSSDRSLEGYFMAHAFAARVDR